MSDPKFVVKVQEKKEIDAVHCTLSIEGKDVWQFQFDKSLLRATKEVDMLDHAVRRGMEDYMRKVKYETQFVL